MDCWSAASTWSGEGLRREVFFFDSGPDRLYGSLYAAEAANRDLRLVICPSWGFELFELYQLAHLLARRVAELGGAAVLFHPPGHGDSTGAIETLTVPRSVEVAVEAARQAEMRIRKEGWGFLGIRAGAYTALGAAQATAAPLLVLVLPPLDVRGYVEELRRARRRALGHATPQSIVFGHPVPITALEDADPDVTGALGRFPGQAVVIRAAKDRDDGVPRHVHDIRVPIELRTPATASEQERLAAATAGWLAEAGRGRSAGAA